MKRCGFGCEGLELPDHVRILSSDRNHAPRDFFVGSDFVTVASGLRGAHQIGRRCFDERSAETLLPIVDAARKFALHIFHEFVDFALHLFHFSTHVEDDLDAGEVDAQISGQCQNCFELLEIFFGIQARVAFGA